MKTLARFHREVAEIAAQYPESRSAVMPALRLAQEHHGGWLPPEAFRAVADALDLTPAYVKGVATFYDMFHLEAVGRRLVEVCTNICCGLAGADERDLTQLDEYRAVGGYAQLERARGMAPAAVADELNGANLRGRGGAFFATGRKMQFIPSKEQNPKPHYVCINADESEPGTFKDREIMNRVPHRLIEGALIAAHAVDSQHVFIYIRGEYLDPLDSLRSALEQAREAELLGGVTVVLHRGAGAYICGEESGLLESLEGKRGQARSRPPFPAISGLYASPPLINNVETIATIPKVLELGGTEYAKVGAPPDSTGTRLFCVSGNVVRGGNYELPMGISMR